MTDTATLTATRTEQRTEPSAKHDLAEIKRALTVLFEPGQVVELRIPKTGKTGTVSGYFDDMAALAKAAAQWSGQAPGVYVTINTCEPSLLARSCNRAQAYAIVTTGDTGIVKRRWLFVDVDPKRDSGISSSDAQHTAALARAQEILESLAVIGWPLPVLADSGNGAHLLYRVDLPPDDGRLLEHVLKALAARYNSATQEIDISTFNPARISKLYGTLAAKGDSMTDRPHRIARLLDVPDTLTVVPVALLQALAETGKPTPTKPTQHSTNTPGAKYDLAGFVARYIPDARGPDAWNGGQKWVITCPWRPEQDGKSAYVVQLPSGGLSAGCQHETCPGSKATGNHWQELRAMFEPGYSARATQTEWPDDIPSDEPEWPDDAPLPEDTTTQPRKAQAVQKPSEPASFSDIDYLKMHQLTQLGNAERLIRLHGHDLRYCKEIGGWLVWDGQRWKIDTTGQAQHLAKGLSQVIYAEVLQTPDKTQQGKLAMCAMKAESLQFVTGTLELAKSDPAIATTPDVWDSNGWLLNVQNGTLDLRTGVLLPHHPTDLITKLAPVTYDPDASDPRLDYFLSSVTGGDPDLLSYLQRAAGYSLTGDTREDAFFLMLGPTRSGKSTYVGAMLAMLGDYGKAASFETFLQRRANAGGARPDVVRLRGARFVGASEAEKDQRLAEEMLKRLTGGDPEAERALYSNGGEQLPTYKIWLAANESPRIRDDNTALWARLKPVPFDLVLSPDKIDRTLKAYLLNDPGARAALLTWALDGCLQWQAGELGTCPRVEKRASALQASFDPLATFLDTCCTITAQAEVEAGKLRAAYDAWATQNMGAHDKPLSNKELGARLTAHGCESRRERRGGSDKMTVWHGIGLQSDEEERF